MMLEVQVPTVNAGGTISSNSDSSMFHQWVLVMAAVMELLACWWQWWRYLCDRGLACCEDSRPILFLSTGTSGSDGGCIGTADGHCGDTRYDTLQIPSIVSEWEYWLGSSGGGLLT